MNIIFFSQISTKYLSGLNWSVSSGVKAQEQIDNCLWVEITDSAMDHWREVYSFHHLFEYGRRLHLNYFPKPFSRPDIVVFEGFYNIRYAIFASELKRKRIPYIIVPASSMTVAAQHNHAKFKKNMANLLIFNRFARQAAAIQFLTKEEFRTSSSKWNTHHFILPNGINLPSTTKKTFNEHCIRAIFIGRMDTYQKGIDILLDSINILKDKLRNNNFTLTLYGPTQFDFYSIQKRITSKGISDIVILGGEVFGQRKEKTLLDSDLFILTSRFEGHPIALLEALSYGIPVAITPGTNMTKEVQKTNAGWTCKGNNKESICQMLNEIISEKNAFVEKSCNARKLASQYDWNQIAHRFHNELSKVIIG